MADSDNPFLYDQNRRMLPTGNSGPILSWIKECVAEGEGFMAADPIWNEIDTNQQYILGRQKARAVTQDRPVYVSHAVVNETRRTHRRHVSALTDVKPTYAYRTPNPHFQTQALLLNNLTAVWWINTFADLALADATSYAIAGGSGDIWVEYDPFHGPLGDMVLIARDARDTIPIRPSRDGNIQNWFGVIGREAHSYNVLAATYPDKINLLRQSASPWGGGIFTRIKQGTMRILGGGATTTLSGLTKAYTAQNNLTGSEIILYKVYLNDPSINTTTQAVFMGTPGTNWGYTVQPGQRLYPRKRLIVATESGILYDGPNPYWHGLFPVSRLTLLSVPWSFFGVPLIDSLVQGGLQDGINDVVNAMFDKIRQKNRPPVAGNSKVPEPMLRQLDLLNPRARVRTNEQIGTGITVMEIPDLPGDTLEFFSLLRTIAHDLTGDSTLDALQAAAANQSFDPETIEAWMNALSPEMKLEGRRVEYTIRTIAEMQKANIFQWYNLGRRMQILGDAGQTLQDFDYDPGNLIPAMNKDDPGYLPELDANEDQKDRAQFFLKLFTFYVTPNSLLALNAQAEKLKYTQMMRAGICDVWTFWEKMEVPNAGEPPDMPLPMLPQPEKDSPEAAAILAGQVPGTQIDPQTGLFIQIRKPITITERLIAQNMMGLGLAATPAGANNSTGAGTQGGGGGGQPAGSPGRKASAQSSPSVDVKDTGDGGKRVTITESPRNHKPRPGHG